jgi:hypothetical protein
MATRNTWQQFLADHKGQGNINYLKELYATTKADPILFAVLRERCKKAKLPSSCSQWNIFRRAVRGKGFTREALSPIYRRTLIVAKDFDMSVYDTVNDFLDDIIEELVTEGILI